MQPVSAAWATARAKGKFPSAHRSELYLPVPILGVLASGADTDYPVTAIADGDRSDLQSGPALTAQGGRGQGVWRGPACFARTSVLSQNFNAFATADLNGQGGWVKITGLLSVAAAVPAGKWVEGTVGLYQRIIAVGPTPARFEFQVSMGGRTDRTSPGVGGFSVDTLEVWIGAAVGSSRAFTLRLTADGITVTDGGGTSQSLGSPTIENVSTWVSGDFVRIVRAVVVDGRLDIYVDGIRVRTSIIANAGVQWAVNVQAASGRKVLFDTLDVWTLAGTTQWARFQVGGRSVGRIFLYGPPVDGGLRLFRIESSPDGVAWTSQAPDRVLGYAKHDGRVTSSFVGTPANSILVLPTDAPRISLPSVIEILLTTNVATEFLRVAVDDPGTSDYKPRLTEVECWRRDDVTRQVQGMSLNHSSDVRLGNVTTREMESLALRNAIARPGDQTYTSADFSRSAVGFPQPDLRPEIRLRGGIVPGEFVEIGTYGLDESIRSIGPDLIDLSGRGRYECQLPTRDPALWILGTDLIRGRLDEMTFAALAASNVPEGVMAWRPDPGQLPVLDLSRKARDESELLRESSGDRGLRFDNDGIARDVIPRAIMGRVNSIPASPRDTQYLRGINQTVWFDRVDPWRIYFLNVVGPWVASGQDVGILMSWDSRKPFRNAQPLFRIWNGQGTPLAQQTDAPTLMVRQPDGGFNANPDEMFFGFGENTGGGSGSDFPELASYDIKQGVARGIVLPQQTVTGVGIVGPYTCLMVTKDRRAVLCCPGRLPFSFANAVLVSSWNCTGAVPIRSFTVKTVQDSVQVMDVSMIEVLEPGQAFPFYYTFVAGTFTDSSGLVVTKVYRGTSPIASLNATTLVGLLAPFAVTKFVRATNSTTDSDLWGIGSTQFEYAGTPTTHRPVRWDTTQALATAKIGSSITTARGASVLVDGRFQYAAEKDSHTLHTLEQWDGINGTPSQILCYLGAQKSEFYRGLAVAPSMVYGARPLFGWGGSGQHAWILPVQPTEQSPTEIPGAILHSMSEHNSYELGGDSTGNAAIDATVQTITPTAGQVVYTQEAYALTQTEKTVRLNQGCDPFSLSPAVIVSRRSPRFPKVVSLTLGQNLMATIAIRKPARFRVYHPDYTDLDASLVDADTLDNPYLWDLGQAHNVALRELLDARKSLQWAEGEAPWWPEVEVGDVWTVTVESRGVLGTYVVRSVNLGTGVDIEGATLRTTVDLVLVQ